MTKAHLIALNYKNTLQSFTSLLSGSPLPKKTKRSREEGNDLFPAADRIHRLSNAVLDSMRHHLDRVNDNIEMPGENRKPCYVVKNRIKQTTDILSKVERKRKDATSETDNFYYSPKHITDGLGYRFVTLFQSDILLVVNELIKMFKHQPPYTDNPILKEGGLNEAVIYTNRPKDDEDAIHSQVQSALKDSGFKSETKDPVNRKSGYSSVHFVVLVQIKGESEPIPMEIQVRDIFEEAWGEIDHALRYVNERDGKEENDIFYNWMPHLNALKTFADGCSQHASMIKINAIDAAKLRRIPSSQIASAETGVTSEIIKRGLPERFHAQVDAAMTARKNALSSLSEKERLVEFRSASNSLKQLINNTKEFHGNRTSDGHDIEYHLKMEYAFCLQPRDGDEEREVTNIYEQMRQRYPTDPIVHYRHAVALGRRGDHDAAEALFSVGLSLLQDNQSIPHDSWIRSAMPRNLGLAIWKKSQRVKDKKTKIDLIRTAILHTESALLPDANGNHGEFINSFNNYVYFLLDYFRNDGPESENITETNLLKTSAELEQLIRKNDMHSLDRMHTVMMVHRYFGKSDQAKTFASKIAEILYQIAVGNSGDPHLEYSAIKENLEDKLHEVYEDTFRTLFNT